MRTAIAPTLRDAQTLCQKARLAGSPGSAARAPLVAEYRRLAEAVGLRPEPTATGRDLVRATSSLLRQMSLALREAAASGSSRPRVARPPA